MSPQPFKPEPLATPIINPTTASLFRREPYISPSEYKQVPTAVGTSNLVPGGNSAEQLAALAAVISRASGWLDLICFHAAEGTLAASPSTEAGWVRMNNGILNLVCNFRPILSLNALAFGPSPANMQNIGQQAAEQITIGDSVIYVPFVGSMSSVTSFPRVPSVGGRWWVVWEYVNGYPHTALAAEAARGATSIQVRPSEPSGSQVFGVYEGTQLTIHDAGNTEVVVVSRVEGLTLHLQAGLQYEHRPPAEPDATIVTAVPWAVEQACVSLVSALIKTRGSRAIILPSSPSKASQPAKQALSQAGGMDDFELAYRILKPFISVFSRVSA